MPEIANPTQRFFDLEKVRMDFPFLNLKVNGKKLVYLDNGATAQKPQLVIDAISKFYSSQNANVHRGVHSLSQMATLLYDKARATIQKHFNAAKTEEIIFTKGTTDSINLVANSFGKRFISKGDEIIISEMEHHSNIVPWQILCEEREAILKVIPINDSGELVLENFSELLSSKTKLVAISHVSNTMGTVNPIKEICELAHQHNAYVLVDGAQAVPHMKVDVQELNCDFYCFSGHKLFGPTGVGILYGKENLLNQMSPYQSGGGMIKTVTLKHTEFAELPLKFEAGTPHIEGGIGLAVAIDYINSIGLEAIHNYETELLDYATKKLVNIEGLRIIGTAKNKASVISFVIEGLHPFDIGTILDKMGVAVRTGHHCNQPLMQRFGIPGTVRASFAFYNSFEEVDVLVEALMKAKKMLQ